MQKIIGSKMLISLIWTSQEDFSIQNKYKYNDYLMKNMQNHIHLYPYYYMISITVVQKQNILCKKSQYMNTFYCDYYALRAVSAN